MRAPKALVWLCVALSACGGSGGGGGGEAPSPTAQAGLVPAALSLGEVLEADATRLRPLRAGAKWTYHRFDAQAPQTSTFEVRHEAAAGGGVTEIDSDDPEGPTSLRATADSVRMAFDLTVWWSSTPVRIEGPELRSPVRVNDQVELLNKVVADTGRDVDGDGKSDGVEVAIYWRVIGWEGIVPVNMAPTRAVRVDVTAVSRLRLSSGVSDPALASVLSRWYVPGIGIVRQRSRDSDSPRTLDSEDNLVLWDGLTEAVGYSFRNLTLGPDVGLPSNTPMRHPTAAVRLPNGLALRTNISTYTNDPNRGWALVYLNKSGQTVASAAYPGDAGSIFALGDRVGSFATDALPDALRIAYYGSDARPDAAHPPISINLREGAPGSGAGPVVVVGAIDGRSLWIVWLRVVPGSDDGTVPRKYQIVARRHGLDGAPLTLAQVVRESSNPNLQALRAVVGANGLLTLSVWPEIGSAFSLLRQDGSLAGPLVTLPSGLAAAVPMASSEDLWLFSNIQAGPPLVGGRVGDSGAWLFGTPGVQDRLNIVTGAQGGVDADSYPLHGRTLVLSSSEESSGELSRCPLAPVNRAAGCLVVSDVDLTGARLGDATLARTVSMPMTDFVGPQGFLAGTFAFGDRTLLVGSTISGELRLALTWRR